MVFGDFIAGKNANIMGPLAVKGTLTGENARINSKKTTACAVSEDALEHHGLVLGGANASPITVNGFASLAIQDDKVVTPLDACAVPNEATLDFEKVHQSALDMSRKLAGMLPNWSIDADGVMVNLVSEGVKTDQPFNLFTMPACTMGACKAVNYFDCGDGTDCEAPPHMLSSVDTMFLGQGEWNGPLEEPFPNSEMVVLNVSCFSFNG
jgi:choice-of-anchor A domain-containing protein